MPSGMDIADRVAQQLLAKRLAREAEESDTSGAGAMPMGAPSSGGEAFDPSGSLQTDPYKAYRGGERMDYSSMMGNSLGGSKTFTKAEIKQGYRKL